MSYVAMVVFGTRPEAIKMAPVVHKLKEDSRFELKVCVTGQHREMLDQVLAAFDLEVDDNLAIMKPGQTINSLTGEMVKSLDKLYQLYKPDIVLVHGDTTTCFIAALSAFQRKISVAHVEAGLRTGDLQSPWPEEANRRLTGVLADLHFAPTQRAKENLLLENTPTEQIFVTGNTVVDALLWMQEKLRASRWTPAPDSPLGSLTRDRMVLVTGHRRESFGSGLEGICRAIVRLAQCYPDVDFVYPVHLNPSVRQPVHKMLGGIGNIHLIEPLDYQHFVWAMSRSYMILTDSGGIQEEAPTLGKPVLVLRDKTERPEALASGAILLAGVHEEGIFKKSCWLLNDAEAYQRMSEAGNPFGDGHAAGRIVNHLAAWLHRSEQTI